MEFTDLETLVRTGLTPVGAGALLGLVLYFLARMVPVFVRLPSLAKRWVIFGLSLLIPGVLLATARFVLGWTVDYNLIYQGLVAGLTAFGSTTLAHARDLPKADVERTLGRLALQAYERNLKTRTVDTGAELLALTGQAVLRIGPFDKRM